MTTKSKFATAYLRPLISAALLNAVFYVLGKSIGDYGVILDHWLAASAFFWAVAIFILIRRPTGPTTLDLWFIKLGLPLLYVLAIMIVATRG